MKQTVFASLLLAASAEYANYGGTEEHDLRVVDWYVKGARGMYYGFYRGMYHDKKMPDQRCMSDDVKAEVDDVMQFLAYGELADIFQLADSLSTLYFDNRDYCKG